MIQTEIFIETCYRQEQRKRVADFLQLVTMSATPIEITTRSLTGEKLFVWVNVVKPAKEKIYEMVADTVEELTTIVAYVQSNGSVFPVGEFGLIAHCDLAFCRKKNGEPYVFTDLKCPPLQYRPPENLGWNINQESINWFVHSPMTLERRRPLIFGEPDMYAVGMGALINAIGVGIVLGHNISEIESFYLSENGLKIWEKFGLANSDHFVRELDLVIATAAVIDTIYQHIR